MKGFRRVVALLLFSSAIAFAEQPAGHAQAQGPAENAQTMAVPFEFGMSAEMNAFGAGNLKTMGDVLNTAFMLTQAFKPEGDSLFSWRGDKTPLKGKEVKLIATTSNDPVIKAIGAGLPASADAATLAVGTRGGEKQIVTYLLMDRLFYDGAGKERPDAMARVLDAMAHEIYGNVQRFLSEDLDRRGAPTAKMRAQDEVNAFKAGLAFLERLKKAPVYEKLSEKLKRDIEARIAYDQAGLRNWEEQLRRAQ